MINRESVKNLVEIFYQPIFKTFYINSLDGKNFVKQVGVFVSLGITTSVKVLEDIKNVINSSNEFTAVIAEISSKKINGQYCNTIINTDSPNQYKLTEFEEGIMNKEQALSELERMKSLMNPEENLETLREYAPKISKLSDLIEKLNSSDGWVAHMIQCEDDGDYRIFHKYVNYKKEGDVEYRIGIYVTDKN